MANQQNYDEVDRRLFGRPQPGDDRIGDTGAGRDSAGTEHAGRDWVEVVDDGSGEAPAAGTGLEAPPHGNPNGTDLSRSRLNPYLGAAWAIVVLMLGVGLIWLFGGLQLDTVYGNGTTTMTRKGLILLNFQMTGVYLLPSGLAGALALLAVQARGYRNTHRD
ncbi:MULTISPECIES: hypothetical protein [unclassified Arthrobacter]|uniref:hypothetical protein n=1 Tax=unclassified Arthrobacter TaxID=235627 RepID=UPI001D155E73|nr:MULTISPECIES: hypothetical protein [unclassified Arthrobacter]MCC3275552.1 hypothetical protein [Arthrobacter sp. zg-Y20]MCC3278626.1 hypothetical protein [Arthrobacter sp. zg-Y40]MCC9176993.1 hypothetical protein [Arthrobacter sp. zg-Y750]MDK1315709.1 hypothetical protein [Arthrobacter sp. zg.Y20]MDK1326296.1 hypothetical protein [Arthrobacter sp. zg-Y1143]